MAEEQTDVPEFTDVEVLRDKPVAALTGQSITPMELVSQALASGAGIDTLERLMQLQDRYEEGIAKKAFVKAMATFKANPPEIFKTKQVEFLDVKYKHATLADITAVVGPALAAQGLSYTWAVDQQDGVIKVTCVVTHVDGYSERVQLQGGADTSGKKNAIQGVGSTVSYLQRYTLLAITGLSTQDQDDDAQASEEPEADDEQQSIIDDLRAASLTGMEELTKVFQALLQKHKKGAYNKYLSDYWTANNKALKNAASVVDRNAKK